jgi:transposase
MYIASIPNRNSPPAILLRESFREGGKVRNRTIANITHWPAARIEAVRQALRVSAKDERVAAPVGSLPDSFEIVRSRPHGHVAAVLGTLRKLGLERVLSSKPSRERDLCITLIAQRILDPRSKLATSRGLDPEMLHSTLGEVMGVETATADELYEAMDWVLGRQEGIESALAKRHLAEGSLVLYDLTSVHFEGRTCPLARLGYSRDGYRGRLQVEFGVITNAEGCPVAVDVFEGNVADPRTVAAEVEKLRERFGLTRVVLVGDRGMITSARIREDLQPNGLDWITALRGPAIKKLVESGALQLSLFDERDLAEIQCPDYPGERLVVCRNPLLAAERTRKREELLQATERELEKIVAATQRSRRPQHGQQAITTRVARVINRYKMEKHFQFTITDDNFRYERNQASIAAEASVDGIYVIRTSLSVERLGAEETVQSYKRLAYVERAFRQMKTVDLKVRPIFHRKEERVRAHILLCMLAYYVEWHMRRSLAPILFDDDDHAAGEALRTSPVAPARRSPRAMHKAATKRTDDGSPVHSFQSLIGDLATITRNRIEPRGIDGATFDKTTTPTPLQRRALALLGLQQAV